MPSGSLPNHWYGSCVTTADFPFSACNGKLIGAQFYAQGFLQAYRKLRRKRDFLSPRDGHGHGTWCAS